VFKRLSLYDRQGWLLAASHTDTAESLLFAGFSRTPRGLRMR
jgi:hypothetical protein